ncbi:MAG TPA: hypothetical protein PKI81_00845 [bacterium]|nr:hypothetical protein [bacterium]HOZ20139.1 hypothetical protein [bacterium]
MTGKNRISHSAKPYYSPSPDLVILWEWEYDDDFVFYLAAAARRRSLATQIYAPAQLPAFLHTCSREDYAPRMVIDRASDVHSALRPALDALVKRGSKIINEPARVDWCRDKATMHLELVSSGINVPYGIIASRHDSAEATFSLAMEKLGLPFVIKPSEGGGGEGVILDASSPGHITEALKKSPTGKVVLQKKVTPQLLQDRRAWFRVFYILDLITLCWWDDLTHLYGPCAEKEIPEENLAQMQQIVTHIARKTQIHFFSTEIAIDHDGSLQVIDFVNEICDMRMRSRHANGVPDALVMKIVNRLIDHCARL